MNITDDMLSSHPFNKYKRIMQKAKERMIMQAGYNKRLKAAKISKWKELIDAEFGVIRNQSVFRIPKKVGFYMLYEDDGSIGLYYKVRPNNKFRVTQREHILEKYPESFFKLAGIYDDRLNINVTNFNIRDQYIQKHEQATDDKGYSRWSKIAFPVVREYNRKGRPNILNKILHWLSFRVYFSTISNNSKYSRLYINETEQMAELYLPNIYKVPMGWASIPLDENKQIDIIGMRGRFDTLPHPFGQDIGEWRITRAGVLDNVHADFFIMQHKCKGKRTYASVIPYLFEDLLKSKDPQVLISCENYRECWDCGEIITNEQCTRLITAQTISSM